MAQASPPPETGAAVPGGLSLWRLGLTWRNPAHAIAGTMRIAIIGTGSIARLHASAIEAMQEGELVGFCGRSPEKAFALAEAFGTRGWPSLEAMLADPAVEAVTIATASGAHLEPAVAAARAGKHVICEKPLEVTPRRVDQMIEACRVHGVTLGGIFNRRFEPAFEVLREAARSGRFGTLVLASARVHWHREPSYYDSAAWRGTRALDGGGALMNQSIHAIDQLLCLAGPVRRVSATAAAIRHSRIEVEDTATAVLEFESGARGTIEGSTACWSAEGLPAEVELCGTEGTALLADGHLPRWEFLHESPADAVIRERFALHRSAGGQGAKDPGAIQAEGHRRNFEEVVQAIRAGREPVVGGAEARLPVMLIDAIYRSVRAGGQPVDPA